MTVNSIQSTAQVQKVESNDYQKIQQLTERWIDLWSPKDKSFTGRDFEQIFAEGENDILVFDNFDGSVVVLRSLQAYIDTWVPVMQQFIYWEIAIEDNLEIIIADDLATTTFSFAGGGHSQDGKNYEIRQYATHVWRKIEGQWRLVHEHLTASSLQP